MEERRSSTQSDLAVILTKFENIERRIDERLENLQEVDTRIEKKLDEYVTRVEFRPVQMIVFGMVGVILTAALMTIIQKVGIAAASTLGLAL